MIEVSDSKINGSGATFATACFLGSCNARLWGLSQSERLRRSFARVGVESCRNAGAVLPERGPVILIRLDYVYEVRLLEGLVASPGTVLVADDGLGRRVAVAAHVDAAVAGEVAAAIEVPELCDDVRLPPGLRVVGPTELGSSYDEKLRKREAPYLLALEGVALAGVEERMFAGAYKGVTDFVTKWLWPAPARWVTRRAAHRHITPNAVTFVSLLLVLVAMWLFAEGFFGLGLVAAWLMTFLDTVDGKLARVTLTSSPLGNVFDHGIDLVHPPFWYAAWAVGLATLSLGPAWQIDCALWIIIGGYLIGRLFEGIFIAVFGLEIHAWRPVDSYFRLITARRNPNLALLSVATVLGWPQNGFFAVAVWTIVSLIFHAGRIVQAVAARAGGDAPVSWLA